MSERHVAPAIEVLSTEGGVADRAGLEGAPLVIGRGGEGVGLACEGDEQLAAAHAQVVATDAGFAVEDRGDPRGVWLRLRGPEGRMLVAGDQLWLGGQLLQVVRAEAGWTLRHHGPDGRFRAAHPVPDDGLFIGRTSDLVLDETDGLLSRRHAQVVHEADGLRFYDRGAHNGSFLRVVEREALEDGVEFRAGSSRFRFVAEPVAPAVEDAPGSEGAVADVAEEATLPPGGAALREVEGTASAGDVSTSAGPRAGGFGRGGLAGRLKRLGRNDRSDPSSAPEVAPPIDDAAPPGDSRDRDPSGEAAGAAEPARTAQAAEPDRPEGALSGDGSAGVGSSDSASDAGTVERVVVVLEGDAGSVNLEGAAGQTVLEIAQDAKLDRGRFVDWECGDGGCGVCVLAIAEGADRLDPPDPATGEMKTIQITEQVAPDPNRYRLACLARVRGPVRLRKMI